MSPTKEQKEAVEEALLGIENVEEVSGEWHPGHMGGQTDILLSGVDGYDFAIGTEDIGLNCAWYIVDLRSGVYGQEFDVRDDDDHLLVATVEVSRFPEL